MYVESKEEGKDQKSIQSSTTPDQGYHLEKWQKHKETLHTREPKCHSFPSWWSKDCKEQPKHQAPTISSIDVVKSERS